MLKKDLDLSKEWHGLLLKLKNVLGKKPNDLNGVLFLIGVQELGQGTKIFSKEEKQDLIHLGICKILSLDGYYILDGLDADGWPHWSLKNSLPHLNVTEQEKFLKMKVIEYFNTEIMLN